MQNAVLNVRRTERRLPLCAVERERLDIAELSGLTEDLRTLFLLVCFMSQIPFCNMTKVN